MHVLTLVLKFRRDHRKLSPLAFLQVEYNSLYSFIYKTVLLRFTGNVENSKRCDARPFICLLWPHMFPFCHAACVPLCNIAHGLTMVAELGQASRAAIRRSQSPSVPLK